MVVTQPQLTPEQIAQLYGLSAPRKRKAWEGVDLNVNIPNTSKGFHTVGSSLPATVHIDNPLQSSAHESTVPSTENNHNTHAKSKNHNTLPPHKLVKKMVGSK